MCNALGMGGERARLIWLLLAALVLLTTSGAVVAICPPHCLCDDDALHASCGSANLDFLPIQLNPEVHHINLSYNKIQKLDFTLYNYNSLISLDLSFNKIQKLGSSNFQYQRNLKYLNLSNNDIINLSRDSLRGLHLLVELDLSFNNLEELHQHTFSELHSLKTLKLSNNKLDILEPGLLKATKFLKNLFLDNNQLVNFPVTAFAETIGLEYLAVSNNYIYSLQEDEMSHLPQLRVLLLDGNVISSIHSAALSGATSLDNLDLSDNNFTMVPTTSLDKLSSLTKLKFGGNFIQTVPSVAFRGLFCLKYLHLDRLEVLETIDPRAFVDNINLERVCLDNNIALKKLPTRLFHGNPHVTHLSVRNNRLSTVEETHFPLDQLRQLRLADNPLECNCSLLWLWRLEHEQKRNKVIHSNTSKHIQEGPNSLQLDSDSIKCAGPEPLQEMLLEDATESQMGCSVGLIATICAIASAGLLLGISSLLLYFGLFKRRLHRTNNNGSTRAEKSELSSNDLPPSTNGTSLRSLHGIDLTHQVPQINKFMITSPLIPDYPVLSHCPWEKSSHSSLPVSVDIYKQFDIPTKTIRPQIVYV